MKLKSQRFFLIGAVAVMAAAIVAIGATWSHVTPVERAVAPDTTASPNPTAAPPPDATGAK